MIRLETESKGISITEEIPALDSCDVLVVGGGIAGVSAACAAAERGLRTVLIEKNTFLGGLLSGGLREWQDPVFDEMWKDERRGVRERTSQEMLEYLLKNKVVLYLQTMAVDVHMEGREVKGILTAAKSGMMEIRARVVIDATHDCMIAQKTGAKGVCTSVKVRTAFGMGRVCYEETVKWLQENNIPYQFIESAGKKKEYGELSFQLQNNLRENWCEEVLHEEIRITYYGSQQISQVNGLFLKSESVDEQYLNRAFIQLNHACMKMAALLKRRIPGFETSFLDWTAPCIGMEGGFRPQCILNQGIQIVEGTQNLLSLWYKGENEKEEEKPVSLAGKWSEGKRTGTAAGNLCRLLEKKKTGIWKRTVEIPVQKECDVLVIGGGASGIVSAIAAARKGMRTILVERNSLLGGDLLAGGLSWLSYYNLYREFGVKEKQLVFGIGYEIAERLIKMGGSPGFYVDEAPYTQESKGTHGDRECMKDLFFQMLEEENVDILLNTLLMDAVVEEENYILGNIIRGAVVQDRKSRTVIRAKVVIDASGDGDMACLAGANCKVYKSHGVGMAFGVTGVNFEEALVYARKRNALAHEAYGQIGEMTGKLVKYSLRTYYIPELFDKVKESGIHNSFCIESSHEGEGTYINGVTIPDGNILDPNSATKTIIELRRRIFRAADFLKENIPGFENSELNWCTPIAGARQTRCIDCRLSISGEDVTNGIIPEDCIGLFGAQDGHYAGYKIKNGGWYGIPYRALLPNFIRNMLVVGRMLSADWVAYMSTRLNVACFIQGQAAGTAAAMAVRENCTVGNINVTVLQSELEADGVYLG